MVPDLFDMDPVPLNRPDEFDMQAWRSGAYHPKRIAHTPLNIDQIIDASLLEMRNKYGCKVLPLTYFIFLRRLDSNKLWQKIGGVGYCFGAKYVVRHLQLNSNKINAGYVAHPSHVDIEELHAIRGPLSIAAAEADRIFPSEKRHESESILSSTGLPYQVNLYSGVTHGYVRLNIPTYIPYYMSVADSLNALSFAVRGDLGNRITLYAKEAAFLQALQWFREHLRAWKQGL